MLKQIQQFIESLDIDFNKPNYYIIYKLIIQEFYSDKDLSIDKINFVFYDKFKIKPETFHSTYRLCNDRIGQTKFRNDLVNFYNFCIITQDDSFICQACHILPYSETKFNHLDNGLLLNYNFHHLFDSFLISFKFFKSFNDTFDLYYVVFSKHILNKNTYANFIKYNNNIVKININSKSFLDISYTNFLSKQLIY